MKLKIDKTALETAKQELMQARENCDKDFQLTTRKEGAFDLQQMCFALWMMLNETITLIERAYREEE